MRDDAQAAQRDPLTMPLLACAAASLVHHAHNAIYLADYPNMPAWITPAIVWAAWLGATLVGISGWLLRRRGHRVAGLIACTVYGGYVLNGLRHYALAPVSAYTLAMNVTILLEAGTALLLLVAVARAFVREIAPPPR